MTRFCSPEHTRPQLLRGAILACWASHDGGVAHGPAKIMDGYVAAQSDVPDNHLLLRRNLEIH